MLVQMMLVVCLILFRLGNSLLVVCGVWLVWMDRLVMIMVFLKRCEIRVLINVLFGILLLGYLFLYWLIFQLIILVQYLYIFLNSFKYCYGKMINIVKYLCSILVKIVFVDIVFFGWFMLVCESGELLVDQIVCGVCVCIDDKFLCGGVCMFLIWQFVDVYEILCFIVVEVFDWLVVQGYLELCWGLGFFVKEWVVVVNGYGNLVVQVEVVVEVECGLDVVWLVCNMFCQMLLYKMFGGGLLLLDWFDGELIVNVLCVISCDNFLLLLGYGMLLGFLLLCQ